MSARLSQATLDRVPNSVARPAYDRSAITPGIVHLGLGAFHRAHQAIFTDDRLAAGARDWGIAGASLRSVSTRDALAPQDGLYTVLTRDGSGDRARIVGAITEVLVAPEDPARLLDRLCDVRTRIVTLTLTEKAYLRAPSGDLDDSHPDIVADLANQSAPRTAHGFIVEALARRRDAGLAPFTIASCDNLPANGITARRVISQFAALRDAGLGAFVRDEVAFPSGMVDRIVPATTDADRAAVAAALGMEDAWPVVTEPFSQWVLEDHFPAGRPRWQDSGVEMVQDVAPFELMKLRLLNGAHSAIAYLGLLTGRETVAESFGLPVVRTFVADLWRAAGATLPAGAGLSPEAYVGRLTDRFDNTALRHRCAQIANDGSQKLPQRIVGPALERMTSGLPAGPFALAVAAWIVALEARKAADQFTDPLDADLAPLLALRPPAEVAVTAVLARAGFAAGSPHLPAFAGEVTAHLDAIRTKGAKAALAAFASGTKGMTR